VTKLLQITFSGITLGSVLALLSVGWVVIFRVSGVLNLAQGSFMVIGALTFTSLSDDVPLLVAASVGVLVAIGVAVTLDVGVLRPARTGSPAAPVIITLGAAQVMAEFSREIWGNDPLRQAPFLSTDPIVIFGAALQKHALLLWIGTFIVLAILWFVFERTLLGKALQACADSPEGARLVGISPANMRLLAFVVAASTGALAGILMIPTTGIGWDSGLIFGIKGFIAAVFGGWSYPGAIIAGLLLGLTENYAAGYIDSAWKDVVTLSVLLVVLLVRPEGLRSLRLHVPRATSRAHASG
jgi:branched-chain amino acid transport system permease protein